MFVEKTVVGVGNASPAAIASDSTPKAQGGKVFAAMYEQSGL